MPTNITLVWKGLLGTTTLAYDKNPLITAVKSFTGLEKLGRVKWLSHFGLNVSDEEKKVL